MHKSSLSSLVAILLSATCQAALTPPWEQLTNEKGIEVFKQDIPGNPVMAFKGQGIVDAPIAKLISILLDYNRSKEWVDHLAKVEILRPEANGQTQIEYTHVLTPFVLKDRDFVVEVKNYVDPKTKTFVRSFHSVEFPGAPKTDYVRGQMEESSFTLQAIDDTHTFTIAEIHADPKGSVAKWIVNLFQKQWPYETLNRLREQAKKTDIPEHEVFKQLLYGKK